MRAQQQRAAERRDLPRALTAKEVGDFRDLLDAPAVVARADGTITQLEAVASWGKEMRRARLREVNGKGSCVGRSWLRASSGLRRQRE